VSEVFVVEPDAEWAVDPVRGRDMVTLQTCTYPDGENRIIVRADRIIVRADRIWSYGPKTNR
jgi:sortase A